MNFDKYYALDTNILLEDARNIFTLSNDGKNLIILSETVLDELDSKKSGFDEINFQAREFARILENSKVIETNSVENHKIIRLKIEDTIPCIIDIISKDEYVISSKNISLNIINDRKILEVVSFANRYYDKNIIFVSMDIMARTRAISMDLNTQTLQGKDSDNLEFEFIKDIEINFEDLETLDNQEIIKFDKEYKDENFSYCFKVRHSDQVLLATIENNKIKLLDENEVSEKSSNNSFK